MKITSSHERIVATPVATVSIFSANQGELPSIKLLTSCASEAHMTPQVAVDHADKHGRRNRCPSEISHSIVQNRVRRMTTRVPMDRDARRNVTMKPAGDYSPSASRSLP